MGPWDNVDRGFPKLFLTEPITMFLSDNPFSMKAGRQLTTFDSLFYYSSDEENNFLTIRGTHGEVGEERFKRIEGNWETRRGRPR